MENLLDILLDCWHEAGGMALIIIGFAAAYIVGRVINIVRFWLQDLFSGRG